MGVRLSSIVNIVTEYRYLICANYMAFYRIEGNDVYIIRVLYGRRDYDKVLFDEWQQDETSGQPYTK